MDLNDFRRYKNGRKAFPNLGDCKLLAIALSKAGLYEGIDDKILLFFDIQHIYKLYSR